MLLLALSCLQGRPATKAAEELLALGPDGLQLTPGNMPELTFQGWIQEREVALSIHHGFDWRLRKRQVWQGSKCTALEGASIHPPVRATNMDYLHSGRVLEVMYPGYGLGSGAEVEEAMSCGVALAVDVSHVFIQLTQGTMNEHTWKRLQSYSNIAEVHVSANDGQADIHTPLTEDSFGIPWALEKMKSGTPLVLECYMHRLSIDERKQQLEFLRG
jgi:hypothetical protein